MQTAEWERLSRITCVIAYAEKEKADVWNTVFGVHRVDVYLCDCITQESRVDETNVYDRPSLT